MIGFFFYYLEKIIMQFDKPTRKFYINIIYGILKSQSIILSDIVHSLNEKITPKKSIERLSRFLNRNFDLEFSDNLIKVALTMMPKTFKIFSVDDTDVIKPYGKKFESLGRLRDGSSPNNDIEKGYRVSCITALTSETKHPMPIFDIFHSETEPGFRSINIYTFNELEFVCSHLQDYEGIFVFDRGYDDYKIIDFVSLHK